MKHDTYWNWIMPCNNGNQWVKHALQRSTNASRSTCGSGQVKVCFPRDEYNATEVIFTGELRGLSQNLGYLGQEPEALLPSGADETAFHSLGPFLNTHVQQSNFLEYHSAKSSLLLRGMLRSAAKDIKWEETVELAMACFNSMISNRTFDKCPSEIIRVHLGLL